MAFKLLHEAQAILEYLGGVRENLPSGWPRWMSGPVFWGVWWFVLIIVVLIFCGQTSKFIYIDF
jgi:hypothetical protein